MRKRFYSLAAFLTLALVVMACVLPFGGSGEPTADQVSTVVALTMQALTPDAATGLLPHSLYFLANDGAGLTQVFRLERDGKTRHQVTTETSNVGNYDVSPVDGSVAYVVNNQIWLVNADGSGRRQLVDGGAVDENNPFLSRLSNPVFSRDGQTLAYAHKGLNFYALSSGVSNRVIEDQLNDMGNGLIIPKELYAPEKYSPDGKKLLITLGYYEGASSAVYYPDSNTLVRLSGDQGALICCDRMQWASDSASFFSANPAAGMFAPGLWTVDAATGVSTTLFTGNYDTNEFNYGGYPYLAPDGQLYYFFHASNQLYDQRTPLQLVRSAADGVTNRTVINPGPFSMMNEALWSPDGSFVITADAPIQDVFQGGVPAIVYVDGRPEVQLADFAMQMKWGP